MRTDPQTVDYKTHILIGVRANGVMSLDDLVTCRGERAMKRGK